MIEYIIVCVDGVSSYDYDIDHEKFYGSISTTIENWSSCSKKEYNMLCDYAKLKSSDNKKYIVVSRIDNKADENIDFSIETVTNYYEELEKTKKKRLIEEAAKKELLAEKRRQTKINKLMKELGLTQQQVEELIKVGK